MQSNDDEPSGRRPVRVSVVIPSYRRDSAFRLAVRSVIEQDLDPDLYELVVVDSSPDDLNAKAFVEETRSAKCHTQLVRKSAEGPASSRDAGWRRTRGEFVAFMDSDCQAHPGWLRNGLAVLADPEIGIVQGMTMPEPNQRTGIFTWYVHVTQENFIYECANVFYRRSALEQMAGFGREYMNIGALQQEGEVLKSGRRMKQDSWKSMLGGEDVDLAWRVKRAGWKSAFSPEAIVYHEVQPITVSQWIWIERVSLFPGLAKKFPEIRRFFYLRYFFDRHQAMLVLGLCSVPLLFVTWFAVLGWIPYLVSRSSEKTNSLPGLLRPIRAMVYLPRDLSTLYILARTSIQKRCVLL